MSSIDEMDTQQREYNSAAKPETSGVTSAEVRKAWQSTEHVKYGDMNLELPKKTMEALDGNVKAAAAEAEAYDGCCPPIQGVHLQYDRYGV